MTFSVVSLWSCYCVCVFCFQSYQWHWSGVCSLNCYNSIYILLYFYSYCYIDTTTLILLHWYYYIDTTTLILLHWYYIDTIVRKETIAYCQILNRKINRFLQLFFGALLFSLFVCVIDSSIIILLSKNYIQFSLYIEQYWVSIGQLSENWKGLMIFFAKKNYN